MVAHLYRYELRSRERAIAERFASRFEAALTRLSEGLSKSRTYERIDQVRQRIGRPKEGSHSVVQHYDITLDTESWRSATIYCADEDNPRDSLKMESIHHQLTGPILDFSKCD